jgi:DNA repair protein RadC
MAAARGRTGGALQIARDATQACGFRVGGLDHGRVRTLAEHRARFLHGEIGVGDRAASGRQYLGRGARRFGGLEFRARVVQGAGCKGQRTAGVGANRGFASHRFLLGVLRALARVERAVERESVVALVYGVRGVLQRRLGGAEFLAGVQISAGAARRFDGAAGLLQFLIGGIAARRRSGHRRRDGDRLQDTTHRRHPFKYTFGCSTMKELSPDDRPREKLLRHGVSSLGDNELVALVLGNGSRKGNALSVANELLAAHGGLHGLTRTTCGDLMRVNGIGQARAAQIVAAMELGRRTLTHAPSARLQIRGPQDAVAYLMPRYAARSVEQFGIVLLDTRHRVLRSAVLAVGSSNSSVVEPRDVFREAAVGGAAAIVVFHNHPSGDPMPSPEDMELTRRLAAAGALMGIDVVDHVVLGDVRYWSFKEAGQL